MTATVRSISAVETATPLRRKVDALIADWPSDAGIEARLVRWLEDGHVDANEIDALMQRLAAEWVPIRIWYLLRCVDVAECIEADLEVVFEALTRLAASDSVFMRADAYRRLAELHRYNLRYEVRAKKEVAKGLKREHGLARKRVEWLLKRC